MISNDFLVFASEMSRGFALEFAAQLLSREPRVFISRPNVRGTLVAVEKAASHSVSLSTFNTWGARSRFKRVW